MSMKCKPLTRRNFLAISAFNLSAPYAFAHDHENLPDGEIARANGITTKLINPTKRYDHAVLGDAIEAGGFSIDTPNRRLVFRLGEDAVFEDRRVRLWDVDGDGQPEAVIVKSYVARGAAIAVYKLGVDSITPLIESAAIGTRNRWLNPVGFSDFIGSGERMIAAVVTPHISGSLRLYKYTGGGLNEIARIDGYTNHMIGSRDLDLARVVSKGGESMIVIPTVERRALALISFKGGAARIVQQIPTPARITRLIAAKSASVRAMLENGEALSISWR